MEQSTGMGLVLGMMIVWGGAIFITIYNMVLFYRQSKATQSIAESLKKLIEEKGKLDA